MTTAVERPAQHVAPPARRRIDALAQWAILAGFVAVVAITMSRHEMWRDELQAWMIARGSTSLAELFHNVRYEGHPMLWYAALLPLTRIGSGPWPMQALQLVVSSATTALVVWRSPFNLVQKALWACGYFAVFEFGVLSRSYSLGLLYVAAICALSPRTRLRWPWSGFLLALLALTSAFGAILAVALGLGLGCDELIRRRRSEADLSSAQSLALGGAVAFAALLWAYSQTIPPPDGGVYRAWRTRFDPGLAGSAMASVWRALMPIPKFQREFWNTNVLDGRVGVSAVIAIALLLLFAWVLARRPGALVVWLSGTGAVVLFLYGRLGYASSSRHYGHIFVLLGASMWLAPAMAEVDLPSVMRRREPGDKAPDGQPARGDAGLAAGRAALWTAVLAVQAVAGVFAVVLDLASPFSNGRDVADYVRSHDLDDAIIVGEPDVAASTVAAYLDRDVYYPAGQRFGQYVIWDKARVKPLEPLREVVRRLSDDSGEPVLILVNQPIDTSQLPLDLLASFEDGIVSDEHFWLYRVIPSANSD